MRELTEVKLNIISGSNTEGVFYGRVIGGTVGATGGLLISYSYYTCEKVCQTGFPYYIWVYDDKWGLRNYYWGINQ